MASMMTKRIGNYRMTITTGRAGIRCTAKSARSSLATSHLLGKANSKHHKRPNLGDADVSENLLLASHAGSNEAD